MRTSILICILLASFLRLDAQTTTARMVGTVRDITGAVLPNVGLTIRNVDTNIPRSTTSNSVGDYVVTNLPVGRYEVTAERNGFKRYVQGPITLEVEQTARIDILMQPGNVTDSVTVEAVSPIIESDRSAIGKVVENRMVVEIPLNGRNFLELAQLLPGMTDGAPGNTVVRDRQDGAALTSNGQRAEGNNYMLDGTDNNAALFGVAVVTPSVDAIQEFKVQTSTYSAEYGRAAGAVFNVAVKSGTNQYHGSVYEFLRNDRFDAIQYFSRGKPSLRRNQYGFSVGGPIFRNRTFFFLNYEAYRDRRAVTNGYNVPSRAQRRGDFTGLTAVYDPLATDAAGNRLQFPSNVIPANRISPITAKLVDAWPLPNNESDLARSYVQNFSNPLDKDQGHIRVDQHLGAKDQLMGRYSQTRSDDNNPSISYNGQVLANKHKSAVLGWTRVFSPTLLHESRLGYTDYNYQILPEGLGHDYTGEFGLPSFATYNEMKRFPTISVRNFTGLGGATNVPVIRREVNLQWVEQLTVIRGRHTMKAGGDARWYRARNFQPQFSAGGYTFNGPFTSSKGRQYDNGLPDLLLGFPQSQTILVTEGFDLSRLRNNRTSLYFQDDVNVLPRLTLNLGLRWERDGAWTEKNNRWAYFDYAAGRLVYPEAAKFSFNLPYPSRFDPMTNMKEPTNKAFAPRIGFAFRPFGNGRTVVRAAYGIFFTQPIANVLLNNTFTAPFQLRTTLNSGTTNPEIRFGVFPGLSASSALTPNPAAFTSDPRLYGNGYVQQWNFGIERQVMRDMAFRISYVGSKSTHLERRYEGNAALPPAAGSLNERRRYPIFRALTQQESSSFATYHGLQTSLERRFAKGLMFLVSYTYSKSLDDTSTWTGLGGQESQFAQDPSRLFLEKGRSGFDLRQRYTTSFIYQIPYRPRNPWVAGAAGGWQLSGALTARTGFPLTSTTGDTTNAGTGTVRPNLLVQPNLPAERRTLDNWFDRTAFGALAPYSFGSAGRNILDGPGSVAMNANISKFFRIKEGVRLQFRGEFFNIPNHPNFGLPNAAFGNTAFATIRSATAPRQVQFALKLLF
ncbi:MAG: TonB-dependent receptor [Acidobacteria bacterium]|nr:TonB-dependent receptor [Acidobacteriota bacterium]